MSCCGQKRMELREEMKKSSGHDMINEIPSSHTETEKKPRIFEYTGHQGLILKGISSGNVYHFRFHGDKIEVNYFDSFSMMAERELKILL